MSIDSQSSAKSSLSDLSNKTKSSKNYSKIKFKSKLAQGKLFCFFGIILPLLAVSFELQFHYCASNFFDPFPSFSHVLIFLLIPLANFLSWLSSRKNLKAHYCFMALASGMASGIAVMYTLMFIPLAAKSIFYIGALGFGLLGLAPALSLPCAILSGHNICNLAKREKTYFDPHQIEHIGHLIILVMVLAIELPSTLTRMELGVASNPATSLQGIEWLRQYGKEEILLRACYEHSGRATDIIGSLYESAHPINVNDARKIYYRVTGKPFNTVAIPDSARATINHSKKIRTEFSSIAEQGSLNENVEDEFDLDNDIAGDSVSGIARGLLINSANITGKLDTNELLGEITWSFTLANTSKYDREARAKIMLPPGSFVNKAVLTINNKDYTAKITAREAARASYQSAIIEHKEKPLLVSTCGVDQILVQAYPIHPNLPVTVQLSIVIPLIQTKNSNARLFLPTLIEKNFQLKQDSHVPIAIESRDKTFINESTENTARVSKQNILLNELEKLGAFVELNTRSINTPKPLTFIDRESTYKFILDRNLFSDILNYPKHLIILIDGSIQMKEHLKSLTQILKILPSSIDVKSIIVCDRNVEIDGLNNTILFLEKFHPQGGQDNSSALLSILDKIYSKNDTSILWIHAAQPLCNESNSQPLQTLLQESTNSTNVSPKLYDLQVSSGPEEILNGLINNKNYKRVFGGKTPSESLNYLINIWNNLISNINHPSSTDYLVNDENNKPNEIFAQLYTYSQLFNYNKILSLIQKSEENKKNEAINLALVYQIVSPVSSAVIMDPVPELDTVTYKPQKRIEPISYIRNRLDEIFARKSQNLVSSLASGLNFIESITRNIYSSAKCIGDSTINECNVLKYTQDKQTCPQSEYANGEIGGGGGGGGPARAGGPAAEEGINSRLNFANPNAGRAVDCAPATVLGSIEPNTSDKLSKDGRERFFHQNQNQIENIPQKTGSLQEVEKSQELRKAEEPREEDQLKGLDSIEGSDLENNKTESKKNKEARLDEKSANEENLCRPYSASEINNRNESWIYLVDLIIAIIVINFLKNAELLRARRLAFLWKNITNKTLLKR